MADFSKRKTCKSKRYRQCVDCSRTIIPGETHIVLVGTIDGEFREYRVCEKCNTAHAERYGK